MLTIDIDTGGTFTDGFFTREGEFKTAKVLTTPHDLTVCLGNCIMEGSKLLNVSLKDMLAKTDVIRYSTTIAVNTLITRTGAKIGLMVTKGNKDKLYSEKKEDKWKLLSFISEALIVEIDEEIGEDGIIKKPLNKKDVLEKMQYLIDMGVRAITVSLLNSDKNHVHEKEVKRLIKGQYPNYYLGSVRVFLASEMSRRPNAFARTNTVVVNGYIHDSLVKYLYKADEELRTNGFLHPLMVAHSHGGVARVAKTRAIDSISSGPALGLLGSTKTASLYGFKNILTIDVGGTSLDLGIVKDGTFNYTEQPHIAHLPISVPMITTYSAPIASGSIAWVDKSKGLQIGPKSAGAKPGPVCFDLGGMEPTVTDADVVLGFIDPTYFLGGRIRLNKERAAQAIKAKIADPLNATVEEAACLIREKMGERTQQEILNFLGSEDVKAEALKEFAVVVYGGAGPTHYCDFVKDLSVGCSITTPYASVFSAFGASTTDLVHTYSRPLSIELRNEKHYLTDYEVFNHEVSELLTTAQRDIAGEGFSPEDAKYFLDIEGAESLKGITVKTEKIFLRSEKDVKELCYKFDTNPSRKTDPIKISNIVLRASVPMPHLEMRQTPISEEDPAKAFKNERNIYWTREKEYEKTPIYERSLLRPGNRIEGPAIVEAADTTYVIPSGMFMTVDGYGNAIINMR